MVSRNPPTVTGKLDNAVRSWYLILSHQILWGNSMKHYVVISADCHAGPNSPVYKDFLDPQYHDDFDVELAQRQALIDERREAAGMSPFRGDADIQEARRGEDDE